MASLASRLADLAARIAQEFNLVRPGLVTREELNTLAADGELVAGRHYTITDEDLVAYALAADNYVTLVSDPMPQPFGDELVTNGSFASGASWSLSGGGSAPTISTDKLRGAGVAGLGSAIQAIAITGGLIYRVSYTIDSISAGNVSAALGSVTGTARTAAGDYAEYIVAAGSAEVSILFSSGCNAVVDNVSVRVVSEQGNLGPELWPQPGFDSSAGLTLTQCSVAGSKLTVAGPGLVWRARCTSSATLVAGDIYRGSITQDSNIGEVVRLSIGNTTACSSAAPGTFTETVRTSAANQFLDVTGSVDADAVIDNVSIRKVILPPL